MECRGTHVLFIASAFLQPDFVATLLAAEEGKLVAIFASMVGAGLLLYAYSFVKQYNAGMMTEEYRRAQGKAGCCSGGGCGSGGGGDDGDFGHSHGHSARSAEESDEDDDYSDEDDYGKDDAPVVGGGGSSHGHGHGHGSATNKKDQ